MMGLVRICFKLCEVRFGYVRFGWPWLSYVGLSLYIMGLVWLEYVTVILGYFELG